MLDDGQSVVITGALSGIGRTTALAFARQGAKLTLGPPSGDHVRRVTDVPVKAHEQVAHTSSPNVSAPLARTALLLAALALLAACAHVEPDTSSADGRTGFYGAASGGLGR